MGLSFLPNPQVKNIHLVDPSDDVVKVLKQKLIDSYITIPDSIFVHHQKGQDLKLNHESKLVMIAGMGGKEIKQIIEALTPQMKAQDRLVISPHRYVFELRSFLNPSEWRLQKEVLVKENQQFYQILSLEKNPELPEVHPFGLSLWADQLGQEYREHLLRTFSLHKDTLSGSLVAYLKQLSC